MNYFFKAFHMTAGWTRLDLAGKPADAFIPASPRFALLFLHDHAGPSPALTPALTALLTELRLACVAPMGGACWWVDRVWPPFDANITPERFLLEQVVPWLESEWKLGLRAIAGIGMGGQAALRLGFRHPDRFPIVTSLDGALDFHEWHGRGTALDTQYESRERARQDTAILHIEPSRWPAHISFACSPTSEWYRGNDRLAEKLTAYGISHAADLDSITPLEARLAPMLHFLANGLERESRRLM